jgi:hypothetical protein
VIVDALRRFGEAIHDGHQFVVDVANIRMLDTSFPLVLDRFGPDGDMVITHSPSDDFPIGGTITSIGGEDARAWLDRELMRTSAATEGYRFNIAQRRVTAGTGVVELGVRDVNGVESTARIEGITSTTAAFYSPTRRPCGSLAELGKPRIVYINMDVGIVPDVPSSRRPRTSPPAATSSSKRRSSRSRPASESARLR